MNDEFIVNLLDRSSCAHRADDRDRSAAGRSLSPTERVFINQHDPSTSLGAGPRAEPLCDGQSGEAGAGDDHIVVIRDS